jgi:hypothetical protein
MRLVVLCLALLFAGCGLTGPSEDLSGHWTARSIGHSSFVGFTLRQSGDDITGTACAMSDGVVLYSGVAVSGEHPRVQFTVASPLGVSFSGRQDSTKDIVGTYGTVDLRFERSPTSLCP